ncbi:Gpi1-domain-containing protein [Auricularia subglabra TFB-10046 SS5]|nr:Gpi1-domain-containing protein [Auricularia subglabra TFB-10046 SS5]
MASSIAERLPSFWNCVWLLLNDCILGYAVGCFMIDNHVIVGAGISATVQWLSHTCVAESLAWLDSWPVGLKLNTELSSFFHLGFLAITRIFASTFQMAAPLLPGVVFLFGAVGICSLSLLLALFTDLLTLLTLNLRICYVVAAAVLRFQWHAMYSLFTLFRGKRRNVLRGRVDSWEYDVDQLILGTVLFTLVAFLMPTVLVYYAFFASLRLGVLLVYAGIEVALACVNYFPLFALMLRMKDPARLPGARYITDQHISI